MLNTKLKTEIDIYSGEDFKNLYRQIKMLNMLNQLYDSDAIEHEEFEAEEKQIMGRFKRLKMHLSEYDLQAFAKLYNIEKEYKRINSEYTGSKTSEKQMMSLCLTIGSKFPELSDNIQTSKETREVRDVISLLSQMTHLLSKYKKMVKNPSSDLIKSIDKLEAIYLELKRKNISEQLTAMEYYDLEDAVSKLLLEFSNFS